VGAAAKTERGRHDGSAVRWRLKREGGRPFLVRRCLQVDDERTHLSDVDVTGLVDE
jgi:hypothetical protein